jgi:hypothetical protein
LTVRVNLTDCCNAPEVAVTVTADTVGVDPPVPALLFPPLPPHAVNRFKPRPNPKNTAGASNLRLLRKPYRPINSATAISGARLVDPLDNAADCAAEDIVRVVVAAPLVGVTVIGLNLHAAPAGRPEQVKLTADLNPFCGVTVNVTVPWPLEMIVSAFADSASAKVGGRLMVYIAVATELAAYPGAIAIASMVSVADTVTGPLYTVELVVGKVPSVV